MSSLRSFVFLVLVDLAFLVSSGRIDAVLEAGESELQFKNKIQLAIRDGAVEDLEKLFDHETHIDKQPGAINEPCCGRGTALAAGVSTKLESTAS